MKKILMKIIAKYNLILWAALITTTIGQIDYFQASFEKATFNVLLGIFMTLLFIALKLKEISSKLDKN